MCRRLSDDSLHRFRAISERHFRNEARQVEARAIDEALFIRERVAVSDVAIEVPKCQIQRTHSDASQINILADEEPVRLHLRCGE